MPTATLGLSICLLAPASLAQLNWEGQTGGLLTPFAYTSNSSARGIGHPQVAFHYMNGGPVLGNEFQASFTVGFLKIGEIGFTRSFNVQGSAPLSSVFVNGFNISHVKFRFLPENLHGIKFIPAIAAAAVVRTQVRRLTEVKEGENTTATDFDLIATKTIRALPVPPILLDFGVKFTNASLMGLAANSSDWESRLFGAVALELKGPKYLMLMPGVEFLQQPRHFKEVPSQYFSTPATVPTTLGYWVCVRPAGELPLTMDFAIVQLGGNLGPNWSLQGRHQFTMGISYKF
jgi:hypothetical protein